MCVHVYVRVCVCVCVCVDPERPPQVNDPSRADVAWSVEVALPLKGLAVNTTVNVPPKDGDFWRINFSRVQWAVKVVDGRY